MDNKVNAAINACWALRGKYGLYSRPIRHKVTGDPVILVWAVPTRDEADFDNPDHQVVLSDNGSWWVDSESGIRLMPVAAGATKLANAVFNMMFPANGGR